MIITFYNVSDPRNKLNKTLGTGTDFSGSIKNETSILDPVILINGDITGFNYCYIPLFNRYYFINDVEVVRTGLFRVHFSVDVLMSYKDAIKECNCVVTRTTDPNADRIDAELTDTSTITKLPFNHTFNDKGVNVMVTINGEQSEGGNNGK